MSDVIDLEKRRIEADLKRARDTVEQRRSKAQLADKAERDVALTLLAIEQARLGERRGQGTLPEIEVQGEQADQDQRPCRVPQGVPGIPDLSKRVGHGSHRRRYPRRDRSDDGKSSRIRQAPERCGKNVERDERRDQRRFKCQRNRRELVGEFRQALRAQRRRGKTRGVRHQKYPRDDAEIAKVREDVAGIHLPYTS